MVVTEQLSVIGYNWTAVICS